MKKKIIIFSLVLAIIITGGVVGTLGYMGAFSKQEPYPYVFVHGLNGWGTDNQGSNFVDYWGATAGNLMEILETEGVECCAPSVGEFNSAWDRSCELYAQLCGGTVDYGAAHSAKYSHERFGKTYDSPLIENWGKRSGSRKINLIGHSFGGATIRTFTQLLAQGSEAERIESGSEVSPLFTGGKEKLVFSVTALAAPHNGTTLLYAIGGSKSVDIIGDLLGGVAALLDLTSASKYLEYFGISLESRAGLSFEEMVKLSRTEDNCYYELTLEGANKLNEWVKPVSNIYYFSYPFDATRDALLSVLNHGRRVGSSEMMLPLQPVAAIIGAYDKNTVNDIPINGDWLENDGLVNTISEKAPFADAQTAFNAEKIERGIWNIMPTERGDHGKAIGLLQSKEWLKNFYMEQINRINKLSERDWR